MLIFLDEVGILVTAKQPFTILTTWGPEFKLSFELYILGITSDFGETIRFISTNLSHHDSNLMQRQMKQNDSDLGPYHYDNGGNNPWNHEDFLWVALESGENYFHTCCNFVPLRKWTSVEISQFRNYATDLKVRFIIRVLLKIDQYLS